MNSKSYITGIIVIILIVWGITYLNNRTASYEWDVNLRENSYEPYDLGYFREVMSKTYGDDFKLIKRKSEFELAVDSGIGTMLYLEDGIKLTDDHIEKLLSFIERGNTAIYSSDILPENVIQDITGIDLDIEYSSSKNMLEQLTSLALENDQIQIEEFDSSEEDRLYEEDNESHNLYIQDSLIKVSFLADLSQEFTFKFIQKDTVRQYIWHGIDSILFAEYNTDSIFTPLSRINDSLTSFFKMDYGEGSFYVHMNPILFSNIYFKEKSGFDYVNRIVENLNPGQVYYNQHYTYFNDSNSSNRATSKTSPLTFILKHDSLRWTFYSILILSLIYVIFAFKRRLPAIPYFSKPKNTSVSHVQALSSFYLSAKNHTILSEEMMVNFKHYLRTRYRLNTNLEKDDLVPLIAKNSGIKTDEIEAIFAKEFELNYSDNSKSKGLIDLYKLLESFYSNCK